MRDLMRTVCCLIAAMMIASMTAHPAVAVLQFYKVFQTEYLDNHPDQEFATFVKKPANRCFVCHQGKNRKHHNAFGEHLEELLDRKKDIKDKEKIAAALKQVVALPFDPNDEKSETYADRIAASKFPAGELEDLKREPAE
jgi:hypothetical protein